MKRDDWQRLKNLALFRLWVTDRELERLWPLAALLVLVLAAIFAARSLL